MTTKKILEKHSGSSSLWDNKNNKQVTGDEDRDIQFAIVVGDNGGDSFLHEYENEREFQKGLQKIVVEGDRGCDFDTSIDAIIKHGAIYTPTIS